MQNEQLTTIRFLWNGIRVDGELVTGAWYVTKEKTVLLYTDTYGFVSGVDVLGIRQENNSDPMTDYFEKTKLYFSEPFFELALEAAKKQAAHIEKRIAKRNAKRLAKANA